jgi:PPP family 3-phenylpropionic acid transporter
MASTATAGGVIASFVGGFLIDSIGVSSTLMIGMITSIIGTVIVLMTVQKTKKAGMSYE